REHTLAHVRKVVAGDEPATLEKVAELYASIVKGGVHKVSSIQVAEAAKVIENTQRDLNIALMNELAIIFHRLGLDTLEVLEAAGTKWNFLPFRPGLVGGHCIGVDPYYLTHKAERSGYHVEVRIHDPEANAEEAERELGVRLARWEELPSADALIVAVAHKRFLSLGVSELAQKLAPGGCFIDVKARFDRAALEAA